MSHCPNCGVELREGCAFCPKCGTSLMPATPADPAVRPVPADPSAPTARLAPAASRMSPEPADSTVPSAWAEASSYAIPSAPAEAPVPVKSPAPAKRGRIRPVEAVLIGLAAVLAVAVIVVGFSLFSARKPEGSTQASASSQDADVDKTTASSNGSAKDGDADEAASAKAGGDASKEDSKQAEQQKRNDALANAYSSILDAVPADFEWYALQDMSGDDIPELIVSQNPGTPAHKPFTIYLYDESSNQVVPVFQDTAHPHRDSFGVAPDGHGLMRIGIYGSMFNLILLTIVDGQVNSAPYTPTHVKTSEEVTALGITPLQTYDNRSDRAPIEALRGAAASSQGADQKAGQADQNKADQKQEQNALESRKQEAYARNPTTLTTGQVASITGIVRGEYKNISPDAPEPRMGWMYWLELPQPIVVHSYSSKEESILGLMMEYVQSEPIDIWNEYLDKTVTVSATWEGPVQGSLSTANAHHGQIVEVFE